MMDQPDKDARTARRAGFNALAGMVATGIYFVSRIALTPFILGYITLAEFGLWSICFVILSYVAAGAVGINNAYIKFTAQFQASGEESAHNGLVSTGFACMLVFAVIFYTTLEIIHPWLLTLFQVAPESRSQAAFMIMGTALVFCLDFTLGGFRSILEGLQEIAITKGVNVGASVFEVILILILLPLGAGLPGLLYAYGIKTAAEMLICTVLVYRKLPRFRLHPSLISRASFHRLFYYVGKVQVLGIIAIFTASFGRFVISAISGLSAAGMFEVGRKFPFTGRNISRAGFAPFFPAASFMGGRWQQGIREPVRQRVYKYLLLTGASLGAAVSLLLGLWLMMPGLSLPPVMARMIPDSGRGLLWVLMLGAGAGAGAVAAGWRVSCLIRTEDRLSETALRGFYLNGLRYIALLNALVFAFLMAAAVPVLTAWVGREYLAAVPVMVLISLCSMIHLTTGPAGLVFRGINRTGREFEFLLVELVTALVWIPAATWHFGITGTAAATLASSGVASIFFLERTRHAFGISARVCFRSVLLPLTAPLLAGLGVYGATLIWPAESRIAAAIQVMILGIFYLLTTGAGVWYGFLSVPEKQMITTKLFRRGRSRTPAGPAGVS